MLNLRIVAEGYRRFSSTAVWRNGGFSASYDSFVGKQTLVLRINICGVNPPLRQYPNRYRQW
jgi:hypothetical protein